MARAIEPRHGRALRGRLAACAALDPGHGGRTVPSVGREPRAEPRLVAESMAQGTEARATEGIPGMPRWRRQAGCSLRLARLRFSYRAAIGRYRRTWGSAVPRGLRSGQDSGADRLHPARVDNERSSRMDEHEAGRTRGHAVGRRLRSRATPAEAPCSPVPRCPRRHRLLAGVPPSAGLGLGGRVAHAALPLALTWQQTLPDAGAPIGQSSPIEATLDGGGPSVVVGDRAGNLWAFHLSNGSAGPRVAGPHRRCPHRLDPVGHPQRLRHRRRLRRRRQRRPVPGRRLLRLHQFGIRAVGQERPGPQRAPRRAGVDGGGEPQRGDRGGGPVAGPGGVRIRCRQRFDCCPGGRSSPPTAASPRRRSPTCTATGRPRWSRAATRPPDWPTG